MDNDSTIHRRVASRGLRKACAEFNSLDSGTGFLSGKAPGLAVTLAFTAKQKGKLSASLIKKELSARKVAIHRLPVLGVDAPARDFTPELAARECAVARLQIAATGNPIEPDRWLQGRVRSA